MKAISLWQPWASAMALGHKLNETRSWATSYRGDLLICSAKRRPTKLTHDLIERDSGFQIRFGDNLPYGYALCVVNLFHCGRSGESNSLAFPTGQIERALGDYSPGRWVWMTCNLRKLTYPIPVRGHQSLWNVDPELEAAVRAQFPATP